MSSDITSIIGFAVLFLVVYVILYRPVLRMLGERPAGTRSSFDSTQHAGEDCASIEPQGESYGGGESRRPRIAWHRDKLLLITVAGVLVADQLSKYLVKGSLVLHESWPSEGFFRLTYGTNTGMAFGLMPNQTLILIFASAIAIAFLYYFYRTQALPSRLLRTAIGLQLGGAFGNLVDRLTTGRVVDFIDVGWWPIFNLADSSIVIGIALLAVVILTGRGGLFEVAAGDKSLVAEE